MKAIRFGLEETQPGQELNNVERMSLEIGDLLCILDYATMYGLVDWPKVDEGIERKEKQLAKFLQHSNFDN